MRLDVTDLMYNSADRRTSKASRPRHRTTPPHHATAPRHRTTPGPEPTGHPRQPAGLLQGSRFRESISRAALYSQDIPRYPKISQDIARRRCQCRRCRHRLLPAYPAYSAYPAYPRSRATAEAARTPPQATRSPAKTQPQAHTPCKNLAFTLYIGPYIIHSVPALRPNP